MSRGTLRLINLLNKHLLRLSMCHVLKGTRDKNQVRHACKSKGGYRQEDIWLKYREKKCCENYDL